MLSSSLIALLESKLMKFEAKPFDFGANSRGYLLTTVSRQYFLKLYPDDQTSLKRIEREVGFIEFVLNLGVFKVPQVCFYSLENKFVVFEYICGEKLEQISNEDVDEALSFISIINGEKLLPKNYAAEAAFTINDFEQIVLRRLENIKELRIPCSKEIQFKELVEAIKTELEKAKVSNLRELDYYPLASPSDFGFHNILSTKKGLYFIDFEYAGIDSLWKFMSDFFAQPAIPIDVSLVEKIKNHFSIEILEKNFKALLYVFHLTLIKWCLIILRTSFRKLDFPLNQEESAIFADEILKNTEVYLLSINEKVRCFEAVLSLTVKYTDKLNG